MDKSKFKILLLITSMVLIMNTIFLIGYTITLYNNASLTAVISNEE